MTINGRVHDLGICRRGVHHVGGTDPLIVVAVRVKRRHVDQRSRADRICVICSCLVDPR